MHPVLTPTRTAGPGSAMEAYDIVNPRSFDTRAIGLRARIFVTKGNPKQQPTNDRRPVLRTLRSPKPLAAKCSRIAAIARRPLVRRWILAAHSVSGQGAIGASFHLADQIPPWRLRPTIALPIRARVFASVIEELHVLALPQRSCVATAPVASYASIWYACALIASSKVVQASFRPRQEHED